MKRIIFAILLCLSFSTIYAQSERKIKKLIEDNEELIADLKSKKEALDAELNRINTEIAQIENRSFERETPEQTSKKKLSSCRRLADISKKIEKNIESSSPLIRAYSYIIEMYQSTLENGGYNKARNELHKGQIEPVTHQVQNLDPPHTEDFINSFERLMTMIKDYRFTMYELVRVFDLVDEMARNNKDVDGIYSSLRADEETEFIDKIPFTKKLLNDYIKADKAGRLNIRKNEPSLETIK